MEFTATNEGFLVPEERPMLSRGKHHYAFSTANSSPSKRFTVLEERSFFRCSEEAQDEADRKKLVEEPVTVEKEHMFDKVVTPSDVGKLNRLVIPKQYAERYFPLDSPGNEKGFLLNFEDRNGKPWRFRYSYWSSSQSYVITKGWSRFVKEKRLNAGDIVSFLRGVGESKKHQLFIDWKHRRSNHVDPNSRQEQPFVPLMNMNPGLVSVPHHQQFLFRGSVSSRAYPNLPRVSSGSMINSYGYGDFYGGGGDGPMMKKPMIIESVPVVQVKKTKKKAELKKLRLFGVNMECPNTDSDECITKIQPPYLHHHSRLGQVLDMEKANWLELN